MINLRIYRATLVLVPIAVVIAMFSLQSDPAGRHSPTAPEGFDGAAAAALGRSLNRQAPRPRPGSSADKKLTDLVAAELGQIQGAEISKQEFTGSFEGNDVDLANVICVLPGESNEQIVMLAGRDAARGDGAGAAASTAALLQIASSFGGSTHRKTLVFVSTDASTVGGQGARRFISAYSDVGQVSAAVVLSTPAAQTPSQPLVVPWSTGPQSTSIELERTAETSIDDETSSRNRDESAFAELARLALPVSLGEQGPLIESGIDAVRISSTGERPPDPSLDAPDDVSADTLDQFGRATLATLLALDGNDAPLKHGPSAYVGMVGNLLPGWALALVSMSLIVPLVLVAAAADLRAARRPEILLAAGVWVLIRGLPLLLALLATYLLGFAGLMPRPGFPYDPGRFPIGIPEIIGLVLIAAVLIGGLIVVKPWRRPPPSVGGGGAAAACATLIAIGGLGVWIANPYLALLIVPALHAWVLLLAESTAVGSVVAVGITLLGLVPLFAALAVIAGHLAVGRDVFWQLFLLLGDGQISPSLALLGCLLGGCGLSALALARSRIVVPPPARRPAPPKITVRGPERPDGA
ncbi:MAG: hypothetical protein ABR536_02350 [Solirubrobacterales bacterium]